MHRLGDHRELHSFPTRRSSDLSDAGAAFSKLKTLVGEWTADTQMGKDRKSTRLNSSHLVISYAVFCLKKKKDKIIRIKTTKQVNIKRKQQHHNKERRKRQNGEQ